MTTPWRLSFALAFVLGGALGVLAGQWRTESELRALDQDMGAIESRLYACERDDPAEKCAAACVRSMGAEELGVVRTR